MLHLSLKLLSTDSEERCGHDCTGSRPLGLDDPVEGPDNLHTHLVRWHIAFALDQI